MSKETSWLWCCPVYRLWIVQIYLEKFGRFGKFVSWVSWRHFTSSSHRLFQFQRTVGKLWYLAAEWLNTWRRWPHLNTSRKVTITRVKVTWEVGVTWSLCCSAKESWFFWEETTGQHCCYFCWAMVSPGWHKWFPSLLLPTICPALL